jgi:hypothetical protein
MATNKDVFDTTYRKTPGTYITGKDTDDDTYNIVHVDANGHLFAKMVGDAGVTNVAIACDSDGYLKIVNPTGAATSSKQDALLDELKLKADLTETQPTKIHADAGGETATALTCDFNGYLYIIPMGVAAGDLKNPISVDSSGRVNINTAVSLPLPSGASTSDNQTDGTQVARITGKTSDTTYQNPRLDPSTHTMQTIDYAHHEIHSGSNFYTKGWLDLTNGQVFNFLIVTPDTTKWAHMLVSFASELESNITVYEGATASNNGTAVAAFNRDRNNLTASTTLVYHTPTVAGGAEGTIIATYKIGSSRAIGGEARSEAELILKQNTKYLVRITNDTANNNWFGYLANWYEHINKTA